MANVSLSPANWMSQFPGFLDRTLGKVVLPGTHHSESVTLQTDFSPCKTLGNPNLSKISSVLANIAAGGKIVRNLGICQYTSVRAQLDAGVRYLDFRVCRESQGVYFTQHTVLGAATSDGLDQVMDFLQNTISEVVLIEFNYDGGAYSEFADYLKQYFGDRVYGPPNANTRLVDVRLRDIVGTQTPKSKVIVLVRFDNPFDLSDYPFWSYGKEILDVYEGFTNAADMEDYVYAHVPKPRNIVGVDVNPPPHPSTPPDQLVKVQYILEFQFGQNPFQTLEHYERDLPTRLPGFLQKFKIGCFDPPFQILYVDYFEKQGAQVMPWIMTINGGDPAWLPPLTDQNTGGLYYERSYQITSPFTPNGTVLCLALNDDNVAIQLQPADPAKTSQHWRLRRNGINGGAAFYNDNGGRFMALETNSSSNNAVFGAGASFIETGLSIVVQDEQFSIQPAAKPNNEWAVQSYQNPVTTSDTIECAPYTGDANQFWQITEVSLHLQIPGLHLELGAVYTISPFSNANLAITAQSNGTVLLDNLTNSADQLWSLHVDRRQGSGMHIYNPNRAMYWAAQNQGDPVTGKAVGYANGFEVVFTPQGPSDEQYCWVIRLASDDSTHVEAKNGSIEEYTVIDLGQWHDKDYQRWVFKKVN